MSEQKTVPMKFLLQLIALQAAGKTHEFEYEVTKFAQELDKTDPELAQYIFAQYHLVPTWEAQ